ncbi:MAG: alpha-amylase family glycosyl hydrolase [Pseudonocardiales bacterium]
MIERIVFGTAQVRAGTTRVGLRPGQTLTVGLGVTATSVSELAQASAFVWTNYGSDDPRTFQSVAMAPVVPSDGHQRAFEVTLPAAALGTFVVTAYVLLGDVRHWASTWYGSRNLVFRVSSLDVDGLYVRQVPIDKANARADSTDISTIDDMLGDLPGHYSLAKLAREGVNCVWVQVPYRIDLWDGLDAVDDAGSDYASTDWFSIDPELSLEARSVPPWDLDLQHRLANEAMRRFVAEAHERGMKVIFGIAPNHVGHNFIFRDHFATDDGSQVRRRDYSQVAVNPLQLGEVQARLAAPELDEQIKHYAEWMLPQMYAARWPDGTYNPFGAGSVHETYSPDWYGRWADTKHLNHGGHPGQQIWEPRTDQNWRVLDYLGRVMRWAVMDLGIDGFRIDHALGMSYAFFEQTLPWVEMEARAAGKESLLLVHEDHDRKDYTARVGDIVQSKGYEGLLHALTHQDADGVWRLYDDPNFGIEFVGTGNHDEVRGSQFFPGDLLAYGNAVMTMQLLGGPMTMLAGDEYAEGERLRFKARGGVPTLWQLRQGTLPAANANLASWIARAGSLRTSHPALRGRGRERLHAREGGGRMLLAAARFVDDGASVPLLVFNNLGRQEWTAGRYDVGARMRASLDVAAFYQVRDRVGFDPERPLWRQPIAGGEIVEQGLSVGLQPYQIQVLELERLP